MDDLKDRNVDWLDARNLCREYCMDLVAIQTGEKNKLIIETIERNNLKSIWTAGRLCDFKGCETKDWLPLNINGWLWSSTRQKINATDRIPNGFTENPWSQTGHNKKPQPDNAEFSINKSAEACMSVANNLYDDGIKWHDAACYHEKPFICEDSDDLLNFAKFKNPDLVL